MKKADMLSEKLSVSLSAGFIIFLFPGEEENRKSRENIFFIRLKLLENRAGRKFESYMIGKMGVWHLRKNPVLF